jgi:hypothetical protein
MKNLDQILFDVNEYFKLLGNDDIYWIIFNGLKDNYKFINPFKNANFYKIIDANNHYKIMIKKQKIISSIKKTQNYLSFGDVLSSLIN